MKYKEYKDKISNIVNKMPLQFAFGDNQLAELEERNGGKDNLLYVKSHGAIINKNDVEQFNEISKEYKAINSELDNILRTDLAFLYDALVYELFNHEYGYTNDYFSALSSLGLSSKDLTTQMQTVLNNATEYVMNNSDC